MDIGLALGGGGARCYAHLGVLRVLHETGLRVAVVGACSTGAVLGALYAAGLPLDEIRSLCEEASPLSFVRLDPGSGMLNQRGLERFLAAHLPATFEELMIPFAVTAVDIEKGQLITLRSGPLVSAIAASNAVPGVFSPVRLHGRELVDGGVLDDVPVDVVRVLTHHPVIAVDTSQHPGEKRFLDEDSGVWDKVKSLWQGDTALPSATFMRAYEYRNMALRQMRYALYPPDLLIHPELDLDHGSFDRLDEAVEVGYRAACEGLRAWSDGPRVEGEGSSAPGPEPSGRKEPE